MQFSQKIDGFRLFHRALKISYKKTKPIREIYHFQHLPKLYIGFKVAKCTPKIMHVSAGFLKLFTGQLEGS